MHQLRIALSLPSAASLGAYEAGAVAALLVAVQRLNERAVDDRPRPVVIDAVGCASAGALTGLLATRCLLSGLDPVYLLHSAWVDQASWRRLRRGAADAPLSLSSVERRCRELLDPRDRRRRPKHRTSDDTRQRVPMVLHLDTGVLQALAFPIRGRGATVEALTHADSSNFVLRPDDDVTAWVEPEHQSPLEVALASMSHPAMFAPRLLDRTRQTRRYREQGVVNVPRSRHLWCIDGGAVQRNPLGGTLAAARHADRLRPASDTQCNVSRMHLLVHPHTAGPDDDGRWTQPEHRPRWTTSLARLVAALAPESLYADMQRIEEVNARLRWAEELLDALCPLLPPEAGPVLASTLERMQREGLAAADVATISDQDDPVRTDAAALFRRALDAVGDLHGRAPVATEVVSPLRLVDTPGSPSRRSAGDQSAVPQLLAGEFLGRFGGLLNRDVRHSDFVSGWRSTKAWLPEALDRYHLESDDVAAAVEAVERHDMGYGRAGFLGSMSLSDLPLRQRARLASTVVHAAGVAVRDAL